VNRASGAIEPRLARDWTSSADGLTWTFNLRDDVKFSDGTPFTSADVVFSFQAVYDQRVKSEIGSSLLINDKPLVARALDEHTVVVIMPGPYGPGISLLDAVPILPSHKLKSSLEAGRFREAWALGTPLKEVVGLGPFMIEEHVAGQKLVFKRNPFFWMKDAKGQALPYLDTLELQFASDQNAEVLHLEAGDVDLMTDKVRFEDLASLQRLQGEGKVRLHPAGISTAPDMMWFNLNRGAASAKDRPWLQTEDLRHAISLAVDRQTLANTVFLGEAIPVAGPITPGHGEWYSRDVAPPKFDRATASKLLASIGLSDRNGDGLVDDASGRTARFTLLTQKGNSIRERSAAIIQEQLKSIGLQLDVVPLEVRSMLERWGKSDYDAILFAIEFDSIDPARNMDFWRSSAPFHVWQPRQSTPATTWEAKIDDLIAKQSTTLDSAERRRLFADAQRTLAEHEPALYFAAPKIILATSGRVRGITPAVLPPNILWNAEVISVTGPSIR